LSVKSARVLYHSSIKDTRIAASVSLVSYISSLLTLHLVKRANFTTLHFLLYVCMVLPYILLSLMLSQPDCIFALECRQQSSSPAPRGASPKPAPASASRKQKSSPSASQAVHRQTVISLATRQQAGKAGNPESNPDAAQPSILQNPQGNVLAAANGQAVASGADSKIDSKGSVESLDKMRSGPQRTDSGKMLNPFASTFIPRTASGNVLSTSASSSQ